jgi:hypothetical protein
MAEICIQTSDNSGLGPNRSTVNQFTDADLDARTAASSASGISGPPRARGALFRCDPRLRRRNSRQRALGWKQTGDYRRM